VFIPTRNSLAVSLEGRRNSLKYKYFSVFSKQGFDGAGHYKNPIGVNAA